MAIDADLNTGAITEKEARERRTKIQQESNFFGSMDGCNQVCKRRCNGRPYYYIHQPDWWNDYGVMNGGLSAMEALQKYGILTIGDGLVSQVPSLLISLATGILVTKSVQ